MPVTLQQLTATEARLAGLIASGHNNAEIGTQLALDEPACEHHLSEIYRKLGIHSRTELALLLGQDTRAGEEGAKT
jgi:DNA-binding NarL/FixJ family response regulator